MKLTQKQVDLLAEAIDQADLWKGSLHPDDFAEHDAHIKEMRDALDLVKQQRRIVLHLTRRGYTHLFPKVN